MSGEIRNSDQSLIPSSFQDKTLPGNRCLPPEVASRRIGRIMKCGMHREEVLPDSLLLLLPFFGLSRTGIAGLGEVSM
jgi:hypothetical protein